MNDQFSLEKIIRQSEQAFKDFSETCEQIPPAFFFKQPEGKWSIAQHVQHLVISTKTSTAAFALPKFIVRLVGGRTNRASLDYDALVKAYLGKLAQGGKASGRYIPQKINANTPKEKIIYNWKQASATYLRALKANLKKDQLDLYQVPHPLLGKITLRELGYFTIYHTIHHQQAIKNFNYH
jgi:uncharacterized damage-inducible protein DinB